MSSIRMFVVPGQSHITEERRIREEIEYVKKEVMANKAMLTRHLDDKEWNLAVSVSMTIQVHCTNLARMTTRLIDVIDINEQFARIQAQIERIEALPGASDLSTG